MRSGARQIRRLGQRYAHRPWQTCQLNLFFWSYRKNKFIGHTSYELNFPTQFYLQSPTAKRISWLLWQVNSLIPKSHIINGNFPSWKNLEDVSLLDSTPTTQSSQLNQEGWYHWVHFRGEVPKEMKQFCQGHKAKEQSIGTSHSVNSNSSYPLEPEVRKISWISVFFLKCVAHNNEVYMPALV